MKVRARALVVVTLVAAAVAGGSWILLHVPFFRVRQVELEGVRYLPAEQVVAGLGLAERHSLFARTAPLERRLEGLAGVVHVRISRRLPGTLRVQVVERVPIALAPGPEGLVPLDAEGRPLPYDPALTGIDLPVIPGSDRDLVAVLDRVRAADSALYQDVETARRGARESVVLDLGERWVMVGTRPTGEDIRAVGAVRRHLAAVGRPYRELDARYAGWVVVRRNRT